MSLPLIIPAITSAIGGMGSALSAALAIGTTVTGYNAQKNLAAQQQGAINQANEEARVQTIDDYDQLTRVGQQERAAATQKNFENSIAAKKAIASTKASAGEAGIGGLSVTSLLTDIYGREAAMRDGVNQNLENTQTQLATEGKAINRTYRNTLVTRPAVDKPSFAGAVIDGASGAFDAYKDELRVRSKTKP